MTVKVGNIIHTGVFDPGADDDPVAPNFAGEEFSDGFFDWQNSTPVFFAAAQGGSIDAFGTAITLLLLSLAGLPWWRVARRGRRR